MNQTNPLMQFKKKEENVCQGLESANYNHTTGLWEDKNEAPLISAYFINEEPQEIGKTLLTCTPEGIDRAERSDLMLRTIITESGEGIDRSERSV